MTRRVLVVEDATRPLSVMSRMLVDELSFEVIEAKDFPDGKPTHSMIVDEYAAQIDVDRVCDLFGVGHMREHLHSRYQYRKAQERAWQSKRKGRS